MASRSPLQARSPEQIKKPQAEPNVLNVVLGNLLIKPWFPSFYPEEIIGKKVDRLYVCQSCFRYSKELIPYLAHLRVCPLKDTPPPGILIYEKDNKSVYGVDGEEHKLYAQNLSLFAKLFLDTKSVFYDVTTFRYYLLTQYDQVTSRHQVIGFFSKEKMSWDNNNLACILVFPPWQKRGIGQILMGVSYELSRTEGRLGGPEKPLSNLGRKGYLAYWSASICRSILSSSLKRTTIQALVEDTWILPEDVIATLKEMDLIESGARQNGDASIDKARVRAWIQANKISIEPAVQRGAFAFIQGSERPT